MGPCGATPYPPPSWSRFCEDGRVLLLDRVRCPLQASSGSAGAITRAPACAASWTARLPKPPAEHAASDGFWASETVRLLQLPGGNRPVWRRTIASSLSLVTRCCSGHYRGRSRSLRG